jgi:nucleotide-binding universal stress UspA family protein
MRLGESVSDAFRLTHPSYSGDHAVNEILVALDLSEHSDAVLAVAAELARKMEARLTLVHIAAGDPDFVGFEVGPQSVRDARANELHQEHRKLQAWADQQRSAGIDTRALLVQGPTVEGIIGEAKKLNADLIVLGSHSRSRVSELVLGSVSHAVLKTSTLPVLIVPRTAS